MQELKIMFRDTLKTIASQNKESCKACIQSPLIKQTIWNSAFSFFYCCFITTFFTYLNKYNISTFNLPKGQIGELRKKFNTIHKKAKKDFRNLGINTLLSEADYIHFKKEIEKDHTEFIQLIKLVEKHLDFNKNKSYLLQAKKKTKWKQPITIDDIFHTSVVETLIKKHGFYPTQQQLDKQSKKFLKPFIAKHIYDQNKLTRNQYFQLLKQQNTNTICFHQELYREWQPAFELIESFVLFVLDTTNILIQKLTSGDKKKYKTDVIVRLQTRAIHITKEVITLLQGGYPDGAMVRWRGLHEIAVISLFLMDSPEKISEKYLKHAAIKQWKEADSYNTHSKKLKYPPIRQKEISKYVAQKDKLRKQYPSEKQFSSEWGWLPSQTFKRKTFEELEKHTKMDYLHPFYNLACNAIHGGSRGLIQLGNLSTTKSANDALYAGPSNDGLADPLMLTAISLRITTSCVVNLHPSLENHITMGLIDNYIEDISDVACKTQKEIEKRI